MKRTIFAAFFLIFGIFASAQKNKGESKEKSVKEISKKLYKEYKERSSEVKEEQRISGMQLISDFLTDKLPLTLDLGAEPGQNESTIFGIFQYDWSDAVSSRFRLEYNSQFNAKNSNSETSILKTKKIGASVLPYIRYFGDAEKNAKTPLFWVGAGAFYNFNWGDYDVFQQNKIIIQTFNLDFFYHEIGPSIEGGMKFPFFNIFVLGFEGFYRPVTRIIQFYKYNATATYFDDNENQTMSGSLEDSGEKAVWSQPYISQSFFVDIFTYFRIKTTVTYYKIILQQKEQDSSGNVTGFDQTQESIFWRFGSEIVFPSSNRTRKKNSHLWAGIYYELEWNISTTDETVDKTRSGKFVFCFGK